MKAVFFTFFFLCFMLLRAQNPFVETISIEQGLSQGFVPSITQDEDGFLWFATKNGLNRYDGYNFKVFRNDPFDTLSLNSNEVIHVEAVGDFLFVNTVSDKPMLFHRKTHRFYSVEQMFPGNRGALGKIFALSNHSVCASYLDVNITGIYSLNWPPNLDEIILSDTSNVSIEKYFQVHILSTPPGFLDFCLSNDKKNYVLLTNSGIQIRGINSGAIVEIPFPDHIQNMNKKEYLFSQVVHDDNGIFRVLLENNILSFDGVRWQEGALSFIPVGWVYQDQKNNLLWLNTGDQVYGFGLQASHHFTQPVWQLDIGKLVKSIFVDNTGILWLGTDAHGIRKFNPRSGVFKNYLQGYSIYCQPVYNGRNHVFLSDLRKGAWYSKILDLQSGVARDLEELGLPKPYDNHLCITENGNFWYFAEEIGHIRTRLVRYNPEKKTVDYFYFDYPPLNDFPELKYAHPGQIWIFTSVKLIRFDIGSQTFHYFDNTDEPLSREMAVEITTDGIIWIGTVNGLVKAVPQQDGTYAFNSLKAEQGNRNSLPTNSVKSLLIDPAHPEILWIGTNGKGLCRLDTEKNQISVFSVANGILPDDVVYGILPDDESPLNLWISTNRGLTRFCPETGFSQHFTRNDGLQDNEFNTYAAFKGQDGRLFFGGVNGLTIFNPKDLVLNSQPPEIKLTHLSINGERLSPGDSTNILTTDIAFTQRIDLPHHKNNLLLEYAVMDFTTPENNQFSFYLQGAEAPWTHIGFEHSAQYLNLSPGKYVFRVLGTNSFGIQAQKPASIIIVIHAPWYLTWPALVVYTLLFILAGYLFNQYQLVQRLKTAEAKRLKNLDQFKTRFYTNITHEFRTPLTVILGVTEQLINKAKEHTHPLNLIKRNGENLLRLINQILDLTKLESHDLKINYVQGDVLAFLKYISESLHSLANAQNVMLKVESSQVSIILDYDPERLMQIIHNLLSNAIKFTPSGGRVIMNAIVKDQKLMIEVSDSGIGIPEEMQPFLFDRFFQVRTHGTFSSEVFMEKAEKHGSSGIGLSLTRELVQIMGGTIRVESPRPDGQPGTVFTVTLPVSNRAPMEKEPLQVSLNTISQKETGKESLPEKDIKILLIEDNPDVMEYLASCLDERYHLAFAYNGRVGIEAALEHIPDLIISDVMMPEKDGLEVCDFLKNDERTSHIPIILLTAKVTMEARLAGLRRGADVYLDKPFHEEELLVWIEQLIARQQRLKLRYENLSIDLKSEFPDSQDEALELEDSFVTKFRNILEEHFGNPDFSVDDVVDKMGMSRAQLYRKLNSLTGKTVTSHLNAIRLGKAAELLKTGKLTVSEVAYEVGYNDPKYFSRIFTEAYGQSPGQYARSN